MKYWLDGNAVSATSVQYTQNFMTVHRVRPADVQDDPDENSDDLLSEDDFEVTEGIFDDVMKTRRNLRLAKASNQKMREVTMKKLTTIDDLE